MLPARTVETTKIQLRSDRVLRFLLNSECQSVIEAGSKCIQIVHWRPSPQEVLARIFFGVAEGAPIMRMCCYHGKLCAPVFPFPILLKEVASKRSRKTGTHLLHKLSCNHHMCQDQSIWRESSQFHSSRRETHVPKRNQQNRNAKRSPSLTCNLKSLNSWYPKPESPIPFRCHLQVRQPFNFGRV